MAEMKQEQDLFCYSIILMLLQAFQNRKEDLSSFLSSHLITL